MPGFKGFCESTYKLLLKTPENQRAFIDNGGVELAGDKFSAESVSKEVWKDFGKDKAVPILFAKSKDEKFIKSCLELMDINMEEYYELLQRYKNNFMLVLLITDMMNELVGKEGSEFVSKGGITKLSDITVSLMTDKKANRKLREEGSNVVLHVLNEIITTVELQQNDIKEFLEQWNKNAAVPEFKGFCENNYKSLLKTPENQRAFIDNGGLELIYDKVKPKDISKEMWREAGIEKIIQMKDGKVRRALMVSIIIDVWDDTKEVANRLGLEPHKKFHLLYPLCFLEQIGDDALKYLEPLYAQGDDNKPEWKDVIESVLSETKITTEKNRSPYSDLPKVKTVLTMIKGFSYYMQNTISDKAVLTTLLELFRTFENYDFGRSLSVGIMENVKFNSESFKTFNDIIEQKESHLKEAELVANIVGILEKHVTESGADGKLINADNLLKTTNKDFGELEAAVMTKVVHILTKTDFTKGNTTERRKKITEIVKKYSGDFDDATNYSALKVLFMHCFRLKQALIKEKEADSVLDAIKSAIVSNQGKTDIERVSLFIVDNLMRVAPGLSFPKEIADAAVRNGPSKENVFMEAIEAFSTRNMFGPEMLDRDLKFLAEKLSERNVRVILSILYCADKAWERQSYAFPQEIVKKIFSLNDLAAEVSKNERLLELACRLTRADDGVKDVVREVGGISLLVGMKMNIYSVKILRLVVEHSEDNAKAFYHCKGVEWVTGELEKGTHGTDVQEECGRVLLRMCEYSEACAIVAKSLNTVYELALRAKNENVKKAFGCVLARVYYTLLGTDPRSVEQKARELVKGTNAAERLYAALYSSYASLCKHTHTHTHMYYIQHIAVNFFF